MKYVCQSEQSKPERVKRRMWNAACGRSAWGAARGAQRVGRSAWSAARGAQRVERSTWSAARGAQRVERITQLIKVRIN